MAIGIRFDKVRAEHFLDCLQGGKAIQKPTEAGWTVFDMLSLAGACYFTVLSHGPERLSTQLLGKNVDLSKLPSEMREAHEDTFQADISAAIEFLGNLTMKVKDREYDDKCEPVCMAIVASEDHRFHPLSGFKEFKRKE